MSTFSLFVLGLSLLLDPARSASSPNGQCGLANSLTSCSIGTYPQYGGTYYYSPADGDNIQLFSRSVTSCSPASYGDVALYQGAYPGSFMIDCGCLPLDGGDHLFDCPGTPKNGLAAGVYNFQVYLGVNVAVDQFTIVSTQVTKEAPTPSTTITTTTFESTTSTSTITESFTTTTTPTLTVTNPATTAASTTILITPSVVTSTTTTTSTSTKTNNYVSVTQTTKTITAPCTKQTPRVAMMKPVKNHRYQQRAETVGNGYTLANGDGQLTITTTPPGVIITNTVDGGTTTDKASTTTTVFTTATASPVTATVLSGTFLTKTSTTLVPSTTTRTVGRTVTKTVSSTSTLTWLHTKTTTPVCRATLRP